MNVSRQIIVGAGMAGLLAARMLAHREPLVLEAQDSLPNNHSAVLRFRTPHVGEVLGIPFRPVKVIKTTDRWRNPIADALSYSNKTNGFYRTDRSLPRGIEHVDRWIAPPDLIERMARGVDIEYARDWKFSDYNKKVISTIPMPVLLDVLGWDGPRPEFNYVGGTNLKSRVHGCDAHATLYFPDPSLPYSRASITGDELIVEMCIEEEIDPEWGEHYTKQVAKRMGIDGARIELLSIARQPYAKIAQIDDHTRKSLIFWASSITNRAFSLGRFATWRPGLLMDDLIKDIRLIDGWIENPSVGYDMDIHHRRSK